jgi:hypothetical protein
MLTRKKKAGRLTKAELRKIYIPSLHRDALADVVAFVRKRTGGVSVYVPRRPFPPRGARSVDRAEVRHARGRSG